MRNPNIKFSDGVRHLYIPKINTISITQDYGLRFWLANSDNFLISSSEGELFEIVFYDLNKILSCWTSDINRLSCAFLETVSNIKESENNKKFLAWILINYYYSAFYSAHCILKALGFGLIQIDNPIISNMKRKAKAFGQQLLTISSGIYCVNFNITKSRAMFYRVKRYNNSHRGLWQRFSDLLNVLSGVSIVTGNYDVIIRQAGDPYPLSIYSHIPLEDATDIVERIDGLKKILNTDGDFNWLSSVRNIVNYNNGFGVWFPYKSYLKQYDKILTLNSLCYDNPMASSFDMTGESELVKFVKTCQLINAINLDILEDLLNRHPKNKSFLKNGFAAYNRLYRRSTYKGAV